jgi:catalase
MPLPNDERVVALANDLLKQFDLMFHPQSGYRPAHAKGALLTGTFTGTPQGKALTKAAHVQRDSVPVTVRLSDATAMPQIADNIPDANPHGMAIRFYLAEHVHTDIVSHSVDAFPAKDGNEFLEFLRAAAASGPDVPSPKPVEKFVASHPATLAFIQAAKRTPSSLARASYFAICAFEFTNAAGQKKFGRYRIVPEAGNDFLTDDQLAKMSPNFLFDDLADRIKKGPIRFKVVVQIAKPGDVIENNQVHWPEDRELVELGTIELTKIVPDSEAQQKQIIFDPIPRIDGIEGSADPLLELRAAIYLLSGRRRRAAPEAQSSAA